MLATGPGSKSVSSITFSNFRGCMQVTVLGTAKKPMFSSCRAELVVLESGEARSPKPEARSPVLLPQVVEPHLLFQHLRAIGKIL
jgi:hypothetical protein